MKKKLIVSVALVLLVIVSAKAEGVVWMRSLENAQKLSQVTNKPLLLDFWAHWCGPCKKMDSDVWSKEEIKELMENFIPVKIDIDIDSKNASKYGARSIPTIMITDSWGNELYKSVGYKDKNAILKLLTNFSVNLGGINRANQILLKKPDHVGLNLRVAQKYQDYASVLKKEAKFSFIRRSNYYLKIAKKLNKEVANLMIDERIDLLKILNKSYIGSSKSVLKKIDKTFKKVDPKNEGLFYFIKYFSAHKTKNKTLEIQMLDKLKSNSAYSLYLKKAEIYSAV